MLRRDGVIDAQCCDVELLAQKRMCKESAVQQAIQKEANIREFDSEFSQEPNLFISFRKTDVNDMQSVLSDNVGSTEQLQENIAEIITVNDKSDSSEHEKIIPEQIVIDEESSSMAQDNDCMYCTCLHAHQLCTCPTETFQTSIILSFIVLI